MKETRLLGTVFALGLTGGATVDAVAERLQAEPAEVRRALSGLRSRGLVKQRGEGFDLTEKGRSALRVVFIGGGFEVIHSGHLYTINQARRLGDVLVVVVARDSTIRRRKGREPVSDQDERVSLLSSLRQVDAAVLGAEGDIYRSLEKVRPDVVALGYDQHHAESEIQREGSRRGLRLEVVRLGAVKPGVKTTKLLSET